MTAIGGTTFDLFDDFTQEAPRAHGSARRLAVVLAAGALVVGGAVGARAALDARSAPAELVAPETLVGVLADRQTPGDVLVDEPGVATVVPETTRFLGETPAGRHYVALHLTGLVCLVTVPPGDVAEVGCVEPVGAERLLTAQFTSPEPLTVALLPDGLAPEPGGGPWERVGPNLYARAGAPALD